MRGFRKLIVAALAAALVVACVPAAKVKASRKTATKKTAQKPRTAWKMAKIDKLLKMGEYREALIEISGAVKRGERESAYRDSRAKAINGLIGQGQVLEKDRKFAEAAMNYKTALDYYPKGAGGGVEKPAVFLKNKLGSMESSLMEEGLRKYRAGSLEEAVGVWDLLLAFDPDHEEARKAKETAETQLRNLKNLK